MAKEKTTKTHNCPQCQAVVVGGYSKGRCNDCQKAAQARRSASWYAVNRERAIKTAVAWQRANPERRAVNSAAYIARHPERETAHSGAWAKANSRRAAAYKAAWVKENPERVAVTDHKRRALKLGVGATLTAEQWETIQAAHLWCCAYCGADTGVVGLHMDHVVPLSKGGRHDSTNVVPSCPSCNLSKSAKDMAEWHARTLDDRTAVSPW